MPAVNITDLNNAKIDVDHIADIANSPALTATDREGHTKDTVAGAIYKIGGITNRGAWTALTAYNTKDIVLSGGTWYICVVAHISSALFATDSASKWRVYQGITFGDLAAPSGSGLMGTTHPGTGAVARTQADKNRDFINVADYGAVADGTDESAKVQAAATAAKTARKALRFTGQTGTVYRINNVDVAGLDVYFDAGVSLLAPTGATAFALVAIGTSGSRVTTPTRIHSPVHAGGGTQLGLFKAEYCDDAYVVNPRLSGYPMTLINDGQPLKFTECIRPLVLGGYVQDGRTAVQFTSCTTPTAMDVKTSHHGRDGIVFYTDTTLNTMTTDALAIGCVVSDFCVNGEAGRGGVHFYGVRRAKSIGCTVSNDNAQANNSTAAIKFRDCEDFHAVGYTVFNVRSGVSATSIGDYAAAPWNIVPRGSIGPGSIDSFREWGVGIPDAIPCPVTGVRLGNGTLAVGSTTAGAGIFHAGTGAVSGCHLQDITMRGVWVRSGASLSVSGNSFARAGKGASTLPSVAVEGNASVVGNSFSDDQGTPVATLAVRVFSGGAATIGHNHYGVGISNRVTAEAGSTIKRGSGPLSASFAGPPSTGIYPTGTVENGVLVIDSNGVLYRMAAGSWRRADLRTVTATIGATQTTVAHGLGYAPTSVMAMAAADARVWQSAAADATNVYLTASVSVSCQVHVQ